jgi:alkanesulfonate monooxygenase SsuD/methylene tetrahydromethanopterin reductase-like flavin-dependent oxidoreductase (luciferase family)
LDHVTKDDPVQPVRFGISAPTFAECSDPRLLMELARAAEEHGWDGFFLWDHLVGWMPDPPAMADPWIALAGIAATTERIRLGPMVTPLPRRRPWKVARETVTLDHLSGGRLILGVGLGSPPDVEYGLFGEDVTEQTLAAELDEGLAILVGLWRGEPFSFTGKHYQVREVSFLPRPLQQPRIPIWVAGYWPNKPPLRRAARWDGVFPARPDRELTPDEVRAAVAYTTNRRVSNAPFDVVVSGATPGDAPARAVQRIAPLAAEGMTWWLELVGPWLGGRTGMLRRILQGPPCGLVDATPEQSSPPGG